MREIKYQAYDPANAKMLTWEIIKSHLIMPGTNGWQWREYTGLKDKNGKEIYEGDILGDIFADGYISYCEKCKQFQYHDGQGCMCCSGDVSWIEIVESSNLEVVGNIYENRELLEVAK
jgi:uncharacterized phage protein (TIGR01671 family)